MVVTEEGGLRVLVQRGRQIISLWSASASQHQEPLSHHRPLPRFLPSPRLCPRYQPCRFSSCISVPDLSSNLETVSEVYWVFCVDVIHVALTINLFTESPSNVWQYLKHWKPFAIFYNICWHMARVIWADTVTQLIVVLSATGDWWTTSSHFTSSIGVLKTIALRGPPVSG